MSRVESRAVESLPKKTKSRRGGRAEEGDFCSFPGVRASSLREICDSLQVEMVGTEHCGLDDSWMVLPLGCNLGS